MNQRHHSRESLRTYWPGADSKPRPWWDIFWAQWAAAQCGAHFGVAGCILDCGLHFGGCGGHGPLAGKMHSGLRVQCGIIRRGSFCCGREPNR